MLAPLSGSVLSQTSIPVAEADICIIGAGPAGITLALELKDTGLKICLVESGDQEPDPSRVDMARGEITANPYYSLHEARARAFGGSSHLWQEGVGLRSRPLDPIDFERRSGVPDSGWPFGYETLAPYYRRAHELCLLGAFDYDLPTWLSPGREPLDLEDSRLVTRIFHFGETIRVFRDLYQDLNEAANITLLMNSDAVELRSAEGEARVDEAVVRRLDGSAMLVRARLFVLAGGGIDNARLLLLSRSAHEAGLGNEHDLVGRYFQEHLRVQSGIVVPDDPSFVERTALYQRHYVDDRQVVGVLAFTEETLRHEGMPNISIYLRPATRYALSDTERSIGVVADTLRKGLSEREPNSARHVLNVLSRPQEVFSVLADRLRGGNREYGYIQLSFQNEQVPNPDSRVVLGTGRDQLGRPMARLEWRLTDLDRDSIRRAQEMLDSALRKSSVGHVVRLLGEETPPAPVRGFWHHIGTTRMHTDPRHGVVNEDSRIHSVPNVYVAGSSVFPTGGYANPTLTVIAMTMRLADHLKKRLAPTAVN